MIGQSLTMSLVDNKTGQLFRSFMPRLREIQQRKDQYVYDLREYSSDYFAPFQRTTPFTKWVLVEVIQSDVIPAGMESYALAGGTYAVFDPKGPANDPSIFQYIFGQWLPRSGFVLDNRPHFEQLDPKGKKENPEAEEKIWIPIKPRLTAVDWLGS